MNSQPFSFGTSPDPTLDRLLEEISLRLEQGQPLPAEHIAQLSPAQRKQLEQLLPMMELLAGQGRLETTGDGPGFRELSDVNQPLGDFRLLREAGRGGMGVVFEAEQLSLQRRVAVKVLPVAGLLSQTALDRFRTEARAAASLAHQHIVPVYSVGCERGVHYYAMKWIDGCSLADVIRAKRGAGTRSPEDGHWSPNSDGSAEADETRVADITAAFVGDESWYRSSAKLGLQAALALAHAHDQGVVHRDVKPSNLLLDGRGRLWLSDFGLARLEIDAGLTRTGVLLGTLRYMSPEQASGSAAQVDPRTDIYSLGATLYELLTLQPVVRAAGRADAIRELQDLHVVPPRTVDPSIPPPLEQIVLKCLQPDPRDRYRTAADLAEDCARFLDECSVVARSPRLTRRATRWA